MLPKSYAAALQGRGNGDLGREQSDPTPVGFGHGNGSPRREQSDPKPVAFGRGNGGPGQDQGDPKPTGNTHMTKQLNNVTGAFLAELDRECTPLRKRNFPVHGSRPAHLILAPVSSASLPTVRVSSLLMGQPIVA
jgi:hypothetical protein